MRRLFVIALAILFISGPPSPAMADSWMPASKKTYESANHRFRLTVTPRELSSQLDYFEDAVKGKERPGQRRGAQTSARGILERLDGRRWIVIWDKPLVNDVAPVDAAVSNSGRYVVTFDNWHFMGGGHHVVVVYGPDGSLVRSMKLSDFLPDYYVKALPHTVSSIWWRDEPTFAADDKLILKITVPSERQLGIGSAKFVDLTLDPANATIVPRSSDAWQAALADGRRVAAAVDEAERERRAWFTNPLLGPKANEEPAWHAYLREAFYRLDPDWQENSPTTLVLRSPSAPDYKPSVGWLSDALIEKESPADAIAIASPSSPENLAAVLGEIVPKVRPDALRNVRIYMAVPSQYRDRIESILARTGAKVVYLDPLTPIPQSPDRLAHFQDPAE